MYRKIGEERIETRNTTPEILTVHETLQKVKEIGGDTCIMEFLLMPFTRSCGELTIM